MVSGSVDNRGVSDRRYRPLAGRQAPFHRRLIFVLAILAAMLALPRSVAANDPGWTVLYDLSGDVNRDGRPDRVQVLEHESINLPPNACGEDPSYSTAPVRRLVIRLTQDDGQQQTTIDNPTIILRRDEGGVFGDPLDQVTIDAGSILVEHYGGSRWRWGNKLRFALVDGNWSLTGYTEFDYDSYTASGTVYDYDPLMGRLKVTVDINPDDPQQASPSTCMRCRTGAVCAQIEPCNPGTKPMPAGDHWFDVVKKPLVRLENYRCWQSRTGLFKHLDW